jgi:excisionase family DNA binding protein
MVPSFEIHPDTVYHEGDIALSLDVPLTTLNRARREGKLRFSRQGRRVLIRGSWLLAWLENDSRPQREASDA